MVACPAFSCSHIIFIPVLCTLRPTTPSHICNSILPHKRAMNDDPLDATGLGRTGRGTDGSISPRIIDWGNFWDIRYVPLGFPCPRRSMTPCWSDNAREIVRDTANVLAVQLGPPFRSKQLAAPPSSLCLLDGWSFQGGLLCTMNGLMDRVGAPPSRRIKYQKESKAGCAIRT